MVRECSAMVVINFEVLTEIWTESYPLKLSLNVPDTHHIKHQNPQRNCNKNPGESL
jgi:hypothetical protein